MIKTPSNSFHSTVFHFITKCFRISCYFKVDKLLFCNLFRTFIGICTTAASSIKTSIYLFQGSIYQKFNVGKESSNQHSFYKLWTNIDIPLLSKVCILIIYWKQVQNRYKCQFSIRKQNNNTSINKGCKEYACHNCTHPSWFCIIANIINKSIGYSSNDNINNRNNNRQNRWKNRGKKLIYLIILTNIFWVIILTIIILAKALINASSFINIRIVFIILSIFQIYRIVDCATLRNESFLNRIAIRAAIVFQR